MCLPSFILSHKSLAKAITQIFKDTGDFHQAVPDNLIALAYTAVCIPLDMILYFSLIFSSFAGCLGVDLFPNWYLRLTRTIVLL